MEHASSIKLYTFPSPHTDRTRPSYLEIAIQRHIFLLIVLQLIVKTLTLDG
jgi:hypothetical protein